jgi:hypothetical protein
VAAQYGRTADFDGAHHAQGLQGQGLLRAIRLTVLSKNVSQLQCWPGHAGLPRCGLAVRLGLDLALIHLVQRAERSADPPWRHRGVARRGIDLAMAQQNLDDPHVGAVLQQMVAKLWRSAQIGPR